MCRRPSLAQEGRDAVMTFYGLCRSVTVALFSPSPKRKPMMVRTSTTAALGSFSPAFTLSVAAARACPTEQNGSERLIKILCMMRFPTDYFSGIGGMYNHFSG